MSLEIKGSPVGPVVVVMAKDEDGTLRVTGEQPIDAQHLVHGGYPHTTIVSVEVMAQLCACYNRCIEHGLPVDDDEDDCSEEALSGVS